MYYNYYMDRFYFEKSLTNAKNLRSNQTDCENILWQRIRAKRLNGIKFRRQVPIGRYVVDFIALSKKLVIELDSSQHFDNIKYDNKRTEDLEKFGYKVLRFWDNDIINNIDGVLLKILEEYNKF